MNYKVILLLINISIALVMAFIAHRKSKVPGAFSMTVLSWSLIIWSYSYLLHVIRPDLALDKLWIAILFSGMTCAASAQLTFSLSYTNHPGWLSRFAIILLAVMPLITQLLFWVKPWSAIFFQNQNALESLDFFGSAWGRITTFYLFNLTGASVLLLLDTYIRKPRPLFIRSWPILAGSMAPLLVQMLNIVGLNPLHQNVTSLLAFTLTGLGFSYALLNQRLIDAVPVTRDAVVNGISDGWIILNTQDIVVDINPAAERIVGLTRDKVYGRPVNSILSDLPSLGQSLIGSQELEMKRSLKSEQGWRYMNIRVFPIKKHNARISGHLIIWRDITERKLADDARQTARNEMFVLLNAISSAANNAIDINHFLEEFSYQIIYPFRSQIVAIFLMGEGSKDGTDPRLSLAYHLGLTAGAINELTYMPMEIPLAKWIFKKREPLLIDNVQDDSRLPPALQGIGLSCLLAFPLVTQSNGDSKFLGILCLARKDGPVFGPDEIVRLTMISDHFSSLIDSDQRRKLAIALSERQNLLRDLHDSVSQKLYGLVTLTEAAQAAMEAGSSVDPTQVLVKIGENARQAVKEMRLFLFQMQPLEIEKDGFISALHHRLAAVEGRADIKARFLADENINLSKQKEVALYFIAQEALNNVLRHAHAKSVTVTLNQGTRYVTLRILDDGRGFDYQNIDRGGMGLINMKERALQAGGKFRVISQPGEGTRIIVRVDRDNAVKSMKRRS